MVRQRPAGPARHSAHAAPPEQTRAGLPRWTSAGRSALHRLVRDRRKALTVFGAAAVALTGLSSTLAIILSD